MSNNIKLESFEGPLDLLLELVQQKKMDIFQVDLLELANEYIKIIDSLKDKQINLAGEYLVMSATLMQLKAKALVETPEAKKELDKEKDNLLQKLSEYQKYKNITGILRTKESMRQDHFERSRANTDNFQYPVDESRLDGSMDPMRIVVAMRQMFERVHGNLLRQTKIEKFDFSPEERREQLLKILEVFEKPSFEEIFTVPTMNHFAITMLTVLEMAKNEELLIYQKSQNDTITFERGPEYGKRK